MGKGGGGSPAPQTTTAYQTNLPEYAKPYVENMLNAAQKQIYNDDMTSFRAYRPYSTDPTQYFAGPSGLQQSTYREAAGMQTPGQYGMATGLGGLAAMGQMGAGRQFAQQATDPFSIQAYMSPFMQNVVDTQKLSALRDYQIAQPARQAQAVRAGAFGGSRSAIENAEAQRNLMSQLQNIQATGTQKAFEDAQRQQQFGANLGLQGLAGASQTAGMLGQLGGAQQQADIARLGLQNQLGGQQQQFQQGIINQAIQDYATQQQYPFMQLSTMSNLLRGLPMQAMTTQGYQAAPSAISQLGGLGATALGAYGAAGGFRAAQGGEVKSYAGGGSIKGYAGPEGSLVASAGATGVAGSIERQLMSKGVPELVQIAKTNPSEQIREMAGRIAAAKQLQERQAQSMGLEGAPAGNLDDIGMASGGIVAFAGDTEDGSYVDEAELRKKYNIQPGSALDTTGNYLGYLQAKGFGEQTPEAKAIAASIADARKNLGEDYDSKNLWQAVMAGGIGAMKGKSQYALSNIGEGLESGLGQYMKGEARKEDMLNKLRSGEIDLAKLTGAERANLLRYATSAVSADEATKGRLEAAKHNAAIRGIELGRREDAKADAARNREETQIREWTKIFLGTGNTNPSVDQIAAARKQAEDYVKNTKVIKIPD
jgi:hypothetical protein